MDGYSRHTMHIASVAWVLYSQADDLVSSSGVFLCPTTNKIVEYHIVIGLLTKASSHDVNHIIFYLESQSNQIYSITNSMFLCLFQRVYLLERSFDSITYQHVLRNFNSIAYSLENYIMDWHISHYLNFDN